MKNLKLIPVLTFLLLILSFIACTIEEIETDFASSIEGNYKMETYETHSGSSTPNANDKIVISRIDDTHVKLTIDYSSPSSNDLELNNMSVSKSSNTYSLDQKFSNADADASITNKKLIFNINYNNGNFAKITATK